MNDSDFITVFNAADISYRDWSMPCFGFIPIAIALVLNAPRWIYLRKYQREPLFASDKLKWFPTLFLIGAVSWTGIAFLAIFFGYLSGSATLLSGRTKYVEGVVQDFVPMPYGGHAEESFTVKGVPFHYSDYELTAGFNKSASHGGPIRQGLYVRIWYSSNDILKLQVSKS